MGRPGCILTKPSMGKLDVCQERQQRPKKSCHKCAGTLLKAHASEVAHCRVCNAGYHTSDCGLRYFAAGLDEALLHECPKVHRSVYNSSSSASVQLRFLVFLRIAPSLFLMYLRFIFYFLKIKWRLLYSHYHVN